MIRILAFSTALALATGADAATYTFEDAGDCSLTSRSGATEACTVDDLTFSVDEADFGQIIPLTTASELFLYRDGDFLEAGLIAWSDVDPEGNSLEGSCEDICAYVQTDPLGTLLFAMAHCFDCQPDFAFSGSSTLWYEFGMRSSTGYSLARGSLLLASGPDVPMASNPVPAALPLMLTGLAGLGLLRRRRG